MKLIGPINSGAATGGAGVATANADTTIVASGLLYGVYVKYNDSPPAASTDVIVSTKGTSPTAPTLALLTITNAATSGWFYPRANTHDAAGAAQANMWDNFPVHDIINAKIQGANNDDSVDVWLMIS